MTFSLDKIFPIIKADLSNDPKVDTATFEIPEGQEPVINQLIPGTLIMYGVDMGDKFTLLNVKEANNISISDLHLLSINNLTKHLLNKIQVHGHGGDIMMIVCGGNFEAATMLLDYVWSDIDNMVEGDILAGIPTKDLILICDSTNTEKVEKLKGLVRKLFLSTKPGIITNKLYIRRQNRWEYYMTA